MAFPYSSGANPQSEVGGRAVVVQPLGLHDVSGLCERPERRAFSHSSRNLPLKPSVVPLYSGLTGLISDVENSFTAQ